MKLSFSLLFVAILAVMTLVTVRAALERNVLDNGHLLTDPWFVATLCDAYFGFLTFYCWVFYKEATWVRRSIWFVAIMLLGNFAMATYVLIQVYRLHDRQPLHAILRRRDDASPSPA